MTQQPQPQNALNFWELVGAALFFLLGLFLVVQGSTYGVGTITRIGPGFFPVSIGVMLMVLSVAIAFEVRRSMAIAPQIPVRISLAVIVALLSFALLVDSAGLVPAIFAVVFISRFAEPGNNIFASGALAVSSAAFGWLIFIVGFSLPLKPFWW